MASTAPVTSGQTTSTSSPPTTTDAAHNDPVVQEVRHIIDHFNHRRYPEALQAYLQLEEKIRNQIEKELWIALGKPIVNGALAGREAMLDTPMWDMQGREVRATTRQKMEALEQFIAHYTAMKTATDPNRAHTDAKVNYLVIGKGILITLGLFLLTSGLALIPLPEISIPLLSTGAFLCGGGIALNYFYSPPPPPQPPSTPSSPTRPPKKTIAEKLAIELQDARNHINSQQDKHLLKYNDVTDCDQITLRGRCTQASKGHQRSITRENSVVNNYTVGIAHSIGERPTMEETTLATRVSMSCADQSTHHFDIFGVFDGHHTDQAAPFLKDNFARALQEKLIAYNPQSLTQEGIWHALRAAFSSLDQQYTGTGGSTAAVSVIVDNSMLYQANLGDSRIVLNNCGETTQLTEDQLATNPKHKKAIEKRGGTLDRANNGSNDPIPMGRSFGNHHIKGTTGLCCIPHTPKITVFPLKDVLQDSQLIIASDGLWEVASSKEVVNIVHTHHAQEEPSLIAAKLIKAAHSAKSDDNFSVMIVKLK